MKEIKDYCLLIIAIINIILFILVRFNGLKEKSLFMNFLIKILFKMLYIFLYLEYDMAKEWVLKRKGGNEMVEKKPAPKAPAKPAPKAAPQAKKGK